MHTNGHCQFNGLHVGRTLGAAVGSLLISSHGIRMTYLYFGVLAGSTAIIYMIAYHLLLKKMEKTRLTLKAQSGQGLYSSYIFNQKITTCTLFPPHFMQI